VRHWIRDRGLRFYLWCTCAPNIYVHRICSFVIYRQSPSLNSHMATTSRSQNSQYMEFRVETVESKLVCRSNFIESNSSFRYAIYGPVFLSSTLERAPTPFQIATEIPRQVYADWCGVYKLIARSGLCVTHSSVIKDHHQITQAHEDDHIWTDGLRPWHCTVTGGA
jgi:hypothetical protein